jgi:hypothetical protein
MVIKEFLDSIVEDIGAFDDVDLRRKLLVKLSNIEEEILEVTDAVIKTFNKTIPSDLEVRLPYDFKNPKAVFADSNEYTRVEKYEADNLSGNDNNGDIKKYSVDLLRIPANIDKALKLRSSYFEYARIETLRSDERIGYGFKLMSDDESIVLGEIYDNKNIWYPENLNDTSINNVKIKVLDSSDNPAIYDDIEDIRDEDILKILTVFGIYKIELKEGVKEYYLNENGFTYSDLARTTLLTRGSFEGNNQYINLNDMEAGQELVVEYYAGAQKYISEMQNNIMLDKFPNLMYQGMLWKAYETLRKTKSANQEREKYYVALKEADAKAGKMNNFGKEKYIRVKTTKCVQRLPWQRT